METIYQEVWINAESEKVFEALTTKEGLDAWWGPVLNAEPSLGSVVEFDHGLGEPLRMEITELVPNERLAWKCVSSFSDPSNPASEWHGQTLAFEVAPRQNVELLGGLQNVTVVRFRNTGWPTDSRWYGFCNAAWGQTLNGKLKDHCEAGASSGTEQ